MRTQLLLLAAFLSAAGLRAQADFSKDEADLSRKASLILSRFASNAERNKVGPRAKQAYDLIIDHYETDHAQARRSLGYVKGKNGWELVAPDKRPTWVDTASYDGRYKVADEWYRAAVQLGTLHRELGLKMLAGEQLVRGAYHLGRAVHFNPNDAEAHQALGHKQAGSFWGTEEQVAFVNRMREIETKALEVARIKYPVTALAQDAMPDELKRLNLEFHGSKSQHFTIWTRGTQENADNCAMWAERALTFLGWMLGEEKARRMAIDRKQGMAWIGFVWTSQEREDFLKANPEIWQGKTLEEAKAFANIFWRAKQGPATLEMKLTPAQMHDRLIVLVTELALDGNKALLEGVYHAMTWFLMSTSISKHGALPEGTVSGKELELPESTNWWLRATRDQATAGTDWAINQVPREQLSRFRNDVRMKSWNFMVWCMARYPDKWYDFVWQCPADKIPFPEEIDKIGEEVFGRKLAEVEAEWREWARGDSGVAAATGYGPPLLPEKPNKEEIAALERMNQVRAQTVGYVVTGSDLREGKMVPLEVTDLDAEASMACQDHARYLTRYPDEHLKWPEAHEQNPANDGFSPRGMRAAMRSVIIWTTGNPGPKFARDSVDGWIGTVYHRFPLLEHNINRFGFAYEVDHGYAIGVLDMGSLQEPYDPMKAPRYVAWPPPNMKDVPRKFHGIEHPNPLDDQPEADRDITRTGYPVSLQLQREVARGLVESSISLYEVKARGNAPNNHLVAIGDPKDQWSGRRGDVVALWEHTPQNPLLKRMEEKEVVFGIPKAHLKPRTTYQAAVMLKDAANPALQFCWEFTTGSQEEGLKF